MSDKWFDESSVIAYPREIRFLHINGGKISFSVDRHVSEYINKLQNKINDIEKQNREESIKSMILQSKIDKANQLLKETEYQPAYLDCKYCELDVFNKLEDILKENK